MNLKKVISPDTVWVDLRSTTKNGIIEELVDRLVAAGKLVDREAALTAVFEREEKMSTGMQNGVAIPHGKSDSVKELVAAVGLQKEGVDFGSLDGKPAKIFILTVSPVNRVGPHIQFIAEISRLLCKPSGSARILEAQTHQEIYDILTEG